jgi:hypothetical protein|tara:strand:+ start:12568 stop:15318 length:2751 start_codon:yes stop_codon:yes gene_type:complete
MADYSIAAVTRRAVYTGSAGTGPYAFTFACLATSDIAVYQNTTKLTETSDYTVTLSASTGQGSVTLSSAASSSDTITLVGARALARTTDFVTSGSLTASALNTDLDSLVIFAQQLSEENSRNLKAPVTEGISGTTDMTIPAKADRLGKLLQFNSSTGNPEVTTFELSGITASSAELNILDGCTATTAELNIMDGDTAATSTTLADADRIVVNDGGVMKQVALTDFETYIESALDTTSNITTVGALNSGSITSGFGSINNGSSAITTSGTISFGSLTDGAITVTAFVDEDDMSSNSATLIPTQQSVKAYVDSSSPDVLNDIGNVNVTSAADGALLLYDTGTSKWIDNVVSGDATLADSGALTIANNAITTAKINADAVTNAKIADDSIDSEHYVDGSIDTAHIGDLQVTTAKIAADAITGAKLADDAVDSEHYTDGSIDTAHIADLQVTTAKIAADAIDATKIADDAISEEHLDPSVISGLVDTTLASGDHLMFLDATDGQLKKVDGGEILGGGSSAIIDTFKYIATAAQTTFSGADADGDTLAYTSGKIMVFLNGQMLLESDYTATNGTSVVLDSGAAASDEVVIIAFSASNITATDLNGAELILDADGDTSLTADTDDQIDIKIGGSDDFSFKANTFEVQTGSNIDMNGTELILDADGDTSIQADTDDRIDFKVSGTERFKMQSTGTFHFGSTGNETLEGDASSNLKLSNAGGNATTIKFEGASATQMDIFCTASAVNHVRVVGSTTNNPVLIEGVGSDTNIGIKLVPKGVGDVNIAGTLSKSAGSFKIPHPLESKNSSHYLVHSFIEGPQADLIYRGKVDLVGGTASVNIDTTVGMTDGTFVALNTDVQCFTSNETGWVAVKGSVSGNVLTITAQDNTCTDTISWMVVGERQDQFMRDTALTDSDGKLILEPEQ